MKSTGQGGRIAWDEIRPSHGTAQEVSPNVFGLSKRVVAIGAAAILAVTALGTVALAADPPPTATPGATAATTPKTNYGQVFVGKLAAALGIDQAKLQAAVKQAELDTIDQAVANGDLARNPADALKQRVEQSNGPGPFGLFGDHGRGKGMGPGPRAAVVDEQAVLQAVADKLGMSVADLQTQLRSGKSIADIAKDKNLNVQDLYAAAANAAKPILDQAVKDGKLTQAQADQIYQQIQKGQYMLRGPMGGAPAGGGPMGGPMGRPFGGRGMR